MGSNRAFREQAKSAKTEMCTTFSSCYPPPPPPDPQLDEGNRNMAAAAQMSDLKPLPASQRAGGEHTGQHRDMIEKVRAVYVQAAMQIKKARLGKEHRERTTCLATIAALIAGPNLNPFIPPG